MIRFAVFLPENIAYKLFKLCQYFVSSFFSHCLLWVFIYYTVYLFFLSSYTKLIIWQMATKITQTPTVRKLVNKYRKSELMLMRRARAHGSSCSHVILVCLHPFRRNSLFCSYKLPKNHFKIIFLGFKVIQGHQCCFKKSCSLVSNIRSFSVAVTKTGKAIEFTCLRG